MKNNIIIDCPECKTKLRVPSGKHIKFTCPNCNKEFDYDGRIEPLKRKKKKNDWVWSLVIVIAFVAADRMFNLRIIEYAWNGVLFIKELIIPEESEKKDYTKNYKMHEEDTKYTKPTQNYKTPEQVNLDTLVKAIDFRNPTTNDFAVKLASLYPGEYSVLQVCRIYDYIVSQWSYVNDSKTFDNMRSASRSIRNNLSGDCDDFAILIAALIESIGGKARISFAYNTTTGKSHAFTEVYVTKDPENFQDIVNRICEYYWPGEFSIHYTTDAQGHYWLNLDWFGNPQHPGGEYYEYTYRTIYYPTENPPYYLTENN